MMKNLLGGYTFIDMRSVETKTSHTIAGLYGEVQKKIAETDKPLMIHNFVYNGENINDTMITNVEEGDASAIVLTIGTSYKLTIAANSSFTAEAFTTGGGGGTSDYTDLTNKPSVNGETLETNVDTYVNIDLSDITVTDFGTPTAISEEQFNKAVEAINNSDNIKPAVVSGLKFAGKRWPALYCNMFGFIHQTGTAPAPEEVVVFTVKSDSELAHFQFVFEKWDSTTFNITVRQVTTAMTTDRFLEINDTDNTWFTITPLNPIGQIIYTGLTSDQLNKEELHLQKMTAGGITVQSAGGAELWAGDTLDFVVPIQNVLADQDWYPITFTGNNVAYPDKKFLVSAKYRENIDTTWDLIVEVKEADVDTYSTNETLTNKVWADGKPIYRKVVILTCPSTIGSIAYTNVVEGATAIISLKGKARMSNNDGFYLPFDDGDNTHIRCELVGSIDHANNDTLSIGLRTTNDIVAYADATVEYTK